MKKKKRLFGVFLIITAVLIMQLPVAEADAAASASDFQIQGDRLVEYRGTEETVSVPSGVVVIAEDAFEGNTTVKTLSLPDSVTTIEPFAFWGCETLERVTLGKGLREIGDYAFANCMGLTYMSVPSNIRSIGLNAFVNCVNLEDIVIPPQVTSIHKTSFDGCYRLTIQAEEGSYADNYAEEFYKRQQEMPEYQDVEDYPAQEETPKEETVVTGDEGLGTLLGKTKIVGNQAVFFVDNTTLEVMSGEDSMASAGTGPSGENLLEAAATVSGGFPKYTIVDNRIVADQAYYGNRELGKVSLPDTIEEIGQFAFARSSAAEVLLPESVKNIGYGAFYHCEELQAVTLPKTVENVEPKAFAATAWVEDFLAGKNVVGPDGVISGGGDFLISGGVLVAYRGTGSSVYLPEGVRVIAAEAFAGHAEIQEVVLPAGLITIGEGAFEGCTGLTTLVFGGSERQIKDRAFADSPISRLTLPASLEAVGLGAFSDVAKLSYAGAVPATSYEASAQRLSNESYRNCSVEQTAPGVIVTGSQGITASLEGAARSYLLSMEKAVDSSPLIRAYFRAYGENIPGDAKVYQLRLTDNSEIPITRLGKQLLEITLPLEEKQAAEELLVYAVDGNGQLEVLVGQRVKVDGKECLRFALDYVSQVGIVGTDKVYSGIPVIEETTTITSMAAPPQTARTIPYHWILGGALLLSGVLCIVWKKRA